MKRINFKEKPFIVYNAGIILILLVYLFLFLRPVFSSFLNLNARIKMLRYELQKAKFDAANIDNLRKQFGGMKEKLDYIKLKFPKETELASLLETLSIIAKDSQVKIVEIKPMGEFGVKLEQEAKFYFELPILIDISCGYHQLGSFINRLENAPRFMKVTDIKIGTNISDPKLHNARLLVSVFVLSGE